VISNKTFKRYSSKIPQASSKKIKIFKYEINDILL